MSHKRKNEQLRGERLAGDLWTALDSASWQAEEARQEWIRSTRSSKRNEDDDFEIDKIIEERFRDQE